MVCGNDSQNNEAYCNFINYQTDATACVIGRCGLTPAEVYEPRDWAELPTNVQELYGSLGYSELWRDNNFRPRPAAYQAWNKLTQVHRTSAESLGYTQSSWDIEDNGECTGPMWMCSILTEVGCTSNPHWGCTWEQWSEGSMD